MLAPCARDPEGLALLAACKENPRDLAPRLILTDWLEDQGESDVARCLRESLASTGKIIPLPTATRDRWGPLNGCEDGWLCLRPVAETIADDLDELADCPWFGAVSFATLPAAIAPSLLQHSSIRRRVVSLAPAAGWPTPSQDDPGGDFTHLSFLNFDASQLELEDVASLGGDRRVRRLHGLRLGGSPLQGRLVNHLEDASWMPELRDLSFKGTGVRSEEILRFVRGSSVTGLEQLSLEDAGAGNDVMRIIAGARSMPRLRHLSLRRMFLSEAGLRELFRCFSHRNAESLDLSGNLFGDPGVRLLAQWRGLAGVSQLRLNRIGLGSDGLAALARSRHVGGLTSLDLGDNRLVDQNQLADILSSQFDRLKNLSLAQCELGERSLDRLAHSSLMANLEVLDLHSNRMSDAGVARLAGARLGSIKTLRLADNFLGDAGAIHLANARELGSLARLGLGGNGIRQRGMEALAAVSWEAITDLNLSINPLGDEGIARLASSRWLAGVHHLELAQTGMTDEGLLALLNRGNLGSLRRLNLWGNQITDAGADALAHCDALESLTDLCVSTEHLTERGRDVLRNSSRLRHAIIHW